MIRVADLLFSLLGIIILSPVYLTISLLLILTQGFPILFTQPRVGKDAKIFNVLKFRSMRNSNQVATVNSIRTATNDPRITKIGAVMRKYSLDELPQLFNVFLGDMSLVGPRPDTPMQESDYTQWQWNQRCSVKPGITGYAQIGGRSNLSLKERIKLDLQWTSERSFLNYIRVILLTPFLMFRNTN